MVLRGSVSEFLIEGQPPPSRLLSSTHAHSVPVAEGDAPATVAGRRHRVRTALGSYLTVR
eukprot:13020794-Alexandrium_andersonii.AAC.1